MTILQNQIPIYYDDDYDDENGDNFDAYDDDNDQKPDNYHDFFFPSLLNFPFLMLAQYEEEAKLGVQVALGFLCFNFRVSEPVIRVMHS